MVTRGESEGLAFQRAYRRTKSGSLPVAGPSSGAGRPRTLDQSQPRVL
jgi:hypothetical protein